MLIRATLKDQDDLVDEFTIRLSLIEEVTLQIDQALRDKDELNIARKGKQKEVLPPPNKKLDKVRQGKSNAIDSKSLHTPKKKIMSGDNERPLSTPKKEHPRGGALAL
ncbi:hypothetical protein LWI29_035109 [Acer saccharum]|uniref:Uncharacterized protein n=1 Tax=Acer saccharum TaxID=4024 RepID=A0AA39RN63_ACESA|nr:hypothetical protein LWI29_035109 [Acer saccharum]